MCGISGVLTHRPWAFSPDASAVVARMTKGLIHRGPDAEGLWSAPDSVCHLGHRRLSVIDLSTAANQPMISADGRFAIAFNGEIYNFRNLRAHLETKGVSFRTSSDTEVLLQCFIAEGPAAFQRFDGMFAVAIYDTREKVLTLARDRAGEKPLYYVASPDYFAFASELRPLLSLPGQSPRLSERGLALYMALRYVPPPFTIVDTVAKLEAGAVMQIDAAGRRTSTRFFRFDIDDAAAARPRDLDAYGEEIEAALQDSLTARLNSDVPLGAFLSSGVDSSLVCAILTQRMKRPVKSFTIGFEGDASSEHTAARAIARHLGTDHRDYVFGVSDFERICAEIGTLLDEPNGDRSCVPTFLLSQFAREHVTVAISGDAGDELYAGYGRYLAFTTGNAKTVWPSAEAIPRSYFERALPVFPWPAIRETLPESFAHVLAFADSQAPLFTRAGRTMLNALRLMDFESYLPGSVLAKVDRMSMRHGLEVRTPYLSPAMLSLSSGAHVSACVDETGLQKAVLRRLLAKYLPRTHVEAPKLGFGMPKSVFLNNAARVKGEIAKALPVLAETSVFASPRERADRFVAAAFANTNAAWSTIVLAKWIESVGTPL
jgi:asparagine synthase (glutamine-hydrolysing)